MSPPFRVAVEARDPEALSRCLHPGVRFNSPVVFRPYEGRDAVMTVLRAALVVLEGFRYTDELVGDGVHGLVFAAHVGEREVTGWDFLRVDGDGLVTELTVMVRPLSATIALAEAMGAQLAAT